MTFRGERGEVLTLSSMPIAVNTFSQLDNVIKAAFEAIKRTAADRGFRQVSEPHEVSHRNLRCWLGEARSIDESVIVSQCVLASWHAVLTATFETRRPDQKQYEAFGPSHYGPFNEFVSSVFSNQLRSIIRTVERTPPRCIVDSAPRLEPQIEQARSDAERFETRFWLGCPCGSREVRVLCFSDKAGGEAFNSAPLALRCSACDRVNDIFDPTIHGYNGEVCGGSARVNGGGDRQPVRCKTCGGEVGEPIASFSFTDPSAFELLPAEVTGRVQDTFDWFTLELKCAACGDITYVTDYECA